MAERKNSGKELGAMEDTGGRAMPPPPPGGGVKG